MSEERIHELHRKLAEKFIEEAGASMAQDLRMTVKLNDELIAIWKAISKELRVLRGFEEGATAEEEEEIINE